MLAIERRSAIVKVLEINGSAMVGDLSSQFNVTEETIRRDLANLENSKKIRRVHGGAYLLKGIEQTVPVELRRRFFVEEKKRMAKLCLNMIEDRDTIMLDCSTTALVIAQEIRDVKKAVVVITNSFDIVQVLGGCDFVSVICLGGAFKAETSSFRGHMALANLKEFYADKAFVSCTRVHLSFGATDNVESEAKIRATMLAHSQKRILIADNTKFNSVAIYKLAELEHLDYIVTDSEFSEEWKTLLNRLAVNMIVAS